MATLKRAKDGHHYIVGPVFGTGQIATWQVTEEGVSWLRKSGIKDGQKLPTESFRSLIRQGMAYTLGGGLCGPTSLVFQPRNDKVPLLSVKLEEDSWNLAILFPEIPSSWKPDASILSKCSFRINGVASLPSIRLWPGKGGSTVPVKPSDKDYTITAVGSWPPRWDLSAWTGTIPGLDPSGTLFYGTEGEGIRLKTGESIASGASYCVIALSSKTKGLDNTLTRFPSMIRLMRLKRIQNWEAWRLEIPNTPNDALRGWCLSIHHPLAEPAWQTSLLSPPPQRYTAYAIPCVELGQKVIVACHPPEISASQVSPARLVLEHIPDNTSKISELGQLEATRQAAYFSFSANELGTYRVRAISGQVIPLTFKITSRNCIEDLGESPVPLRLIIQKGTEKISLDPFRDGPGPHKLEAPDRFDENVFGIAAQSPVPIHLSWNKRPVGQQITWEAKNLVDLFREDLTVALVKSKWLTVEVDARNYGRLAVHLIPSVSPHAPDLIIPERARNLARWLETLLPSISFRSEYVRVPVPTDTRQILKSLELEYPHLSELHSVPKPLFSYILALARYLSR